MADRSSVSKSVGYQVIGTVGVQHVPKLVAYLILAPGDAEPDSSNRQGHVHPQILRRS